MGSKAIMLDFIVYSFVLTLLGLVVLGSVCEGAGWETPPPDYKYHVRVVNDLSKEGLHMDCVNEDANFDEDLFHRGEMYEWEFVAFSEETHYSCTFGKQMYNQTSNFYKSNVDAFEINEQFLNACGGGPLCVWKAQDDGIYLFNTNSQTYTKKYEWVLVGPQAQA